MNKDELIDYCKEAGQTISELDYKNRILEKENQELKKQVEEYQKDIKDLDNQNKRAFENMQLNQLKVCNMIKQQQEFIKYLEDETKEVEKTIEMLSDANSCRIQNLKYKGNTLKEILQKYKEIIGEK